MSLCRPRGRRRGRICESRIVFSARLFVLTGPHPVQSFRDVKNRSKGLLGALEVMIRGSFRKTRDCIGCGLSHVAD